MRNKNEQKNMINTCTIFVNFCEQKTNVPKLRVNAFHSCSTAVELARSIQFGFSHADKF